MNDFGDYVFSLKWDVLSDAPMKCYQCNSAEEADCESSDVEQLKKYVKPCGELKDGTYKSREPIACRKIVQDVETSPTRIIRECAYTGDKHMDGMRKQGNKAVKLTYYQCENTDNDSPCNGATSIISSTFMAIVCGLAMFAHL
uniref:Protein sleepless n=1 Tax=Ascaris lumbricoides TaxID=6252 RepID=A0A0M3HYK7_ASCLU